jgi:arabinogalactan oligomer/maltooligosaccharide transport system permease protein
MIQQYFTTFCAAAVIVAVPITGLFMWLQKYYVEGVTGGAVKG